MNSMSKKKVTEVDLTTEEKIKEAARKVFTQKGYAATRTRDIADESGINLALLNYYFRSKEKLFHLIMEEKMVQLFGILFPIINNEESALQQKLELIASNYIDLLLANPDLPLFVLSEIRNNSGGFLKQMPVKKLLRESVLVKQLHVARPDIVPLHWIMNTLGMILFPFIATPVFKDTGVLDEKLFQQLMRERKKMIPVWIKAMLSQ
jgi:AcrR family transcriptional regulator